MFEANIWKKSSLRLLIWWCENTLTCYLGVNSQRWASMNLIDVLRQISAASHRKMFLNRHRIFIWIPSNLNYTSSTRKTLKNLKYFPSEYLNEINESKVFSPVFDLNDVRLITNFYPKRNAEWGYKIFSDK